MTPIDLSRLVAPLIEAMQRPKCPRVCTTNGGPNVDGQKWVHALDYAELKKQSDALCAALDPAALAAMLAEVRADALREAARICTPNTDFVSGDYADGRRHAGWANHNAILTLIKEPQT
jgi:hypothetical protein